MTNFKFETTSLKDVFKITSYYFEDNRGSFNKVFNTDIFNTNDFYFIPQEIFISNSCKNVIRGMHFQYNKPQSKIVKVINGSCYDVVVDLRKNSPTYLKHQFFKLDAINHEMLYVPKGYAHGFLSLEDNTSMLYMCDDVYDRESDTGIIYNDKVLNIRWPISDINQSIHSERDLKLMTFEEFESLGVFANVEF